MKKTLIALALALGLSTQAHAQENLAINLMLLDLQASIVAAKTAPLNVINWKVGEFSNFDMSAAFGSLGKMNKIVASEVGNDIWLKSTTTGMIGNNTIEALIDRATGQVKEMRQNGQKQEIPNDKLEIISQDRATVTVPAGTFEAIHIVAKSEKIKKMELWANPRDTALDGAIQTIADTGMLTITLKLTQFGGK
jgi:hypothetical protein